MTNESTLAEDQFRCAGCGHVFTNAVSEDESRAEAKEVWGIEAADDVAPLCEDCFAKVMREWAESEGAKA